MPAELWTRFNLDPVLIVILILACVAHLWLLHDGRKRLAAGAGWLIAAVALVSPLCALSVSLFAARVSQHMLLILVAAPFLAWAMPGRRAGSGFELWTSAMLFFLALWFWHMPTPYDATFTSVGIYWSMHISLFGAAIWLWKCLLHHAPEQTIGTLAAGAATSVQMGLLGAVLTFAEHPLFAWHLTTTWPWGLTPLQDQQLGGVVMWVPGIAFFLWAIGRTLTRLFEALEGARAA